MTPLQALALFITAYLLLLGRTAWKQGEFGQYLRALAMVGGLLAVIAGSAFLYSNAFGP